MRERAVVRDGERAVAVMLLVSSSIGTEVVIEVSDNELQRAYDAGELDHRSLHKVEIAVRDESGRLYERSDSVRNGAGIGQHEFGFFSRTTGFRSLAPDVRRVEVGISGPLGTWRVPVDVAPLVDTGVARKRELDVRSTREGVEVRLVGVAASQEETVIQLDVAAPDGARVRGLGGLMQRTGADRVVLVDAAGERHDEVVGRDTMSLDLTATRFVAKFAPLAARRGPLTVVVPAVIIEEEGPVLELGLPVREPKELWFGPYALTVKRAEITSDLLSPPGEAALRGLRIALGSADLAAARRVLRPASLVVDGVEHPHFGSGWHPDPGFVNLELSTSVSPASVRLIRPIVRVSGPWELRSELEDAP